MVHGTYLISLSVSLFLSLSVFSSLMVQDIRVMVDSRKGDWYKWDEKPPTCHGSQEYCPIDDCVEDLIVPLSCVGMPPNGASNARKAPAKPRWTAVYTGTNMRFQNDKHYRTWVNEHLLPCEYVAVPTKSLLNPSAQVSPPPEAPSVNSMPTTDVAAQQLTGTSWADIDADFEDSDEFLAWDDE